MTKHFQQKSINLLVFCSTMPENLTGFHIFMHHVNYFLSSLHTFLKFLKDCFKTSKLKHTTLVVSCNTTWKQLPVQLHNQSLYHYLPSYAASRHIILPVQLKMISYIHTKLFMLEKEILYTALYTKCNT